MIVFHLSFTCHDLVPRLHDCLRKSHKKRLVLKTTHSFSKQSNSSSQAIWKHIAPHSALDQGPTFSATAPAGPSCGPSTQPSDFWIEADAWKEAIHAAGCVDPVSAAALGRSLEGLYTLLPDLRPHWQQHLAIHQRLVRIEALICGQDPQQLEGGEKEEGPSQPPGATSESSSSPAAPVNVQLDAGAAAADSSAGGRPQQAQGEAGSQTCVLAGAQVAFSELQQMRPFLTSYGTRAISLYHSRSMWALSEALMRAPTNFRGPLGSPLLPARDLLHTVVPELRVLRRNHYQHMCQLLQAQVHLSQKLPEVARLLVALREQRPEQGVDVGRQVATHLLLLHGALQEGPEGGPAMDRLSLMLELDAQKAWRRASAAASANNSSGAP